ncbi:hypothetical protein J6590_098069 [Homalodisca vitripennis]|nr:hypothetical protein J6590_098069 [Homalodisca vitripennis]
MTDSNPVPGTSNPKAKIKISNLAEPEPNGKEIRADDPPPHGTQWPEIWTEDMWERKKAAFPWTDSKPSRLPGLMRTCSLLKSAHTMPILCGGTKRAGPDRQACYRRPGALQPVKTGAGRRVPIPVKSVCQWCSCCGVLLVCVSCFALEGSVKFR